MNFVFEWMIAVHRAMWFPVYWATGLESPAMEIALEEAVALESRAPLNVTPIRRREKAA